MAGEKRFRNSFVGFNKSDVNLYIERMLKEFEDKIREKDEEISTFKHQNNDLKSKYEELSLKVEEINYDRTKISEVLIKAQEKADLIVQEAIEQASEEKNKISMQIEAEKERLVDIKREIKALQFEFTSTLKKYENQLGSMIKEDRAG